MRKALLVLPLALCLLSFLIPGCSKPGPTNPIVTPDTPQVTDTPQAPTATATAAGPANTMTIAATATGTFTAPASPTNTATATATQTSTQQAAPSATVTVVIQASIMGWNDYASVYMQVSLTDSTASAAGEYASSVTVRNITTGQDYSLAYDAGNKYYAYYAPYPASGVYNPGDTWRVEVVMGGNTYMQQGQSPGGFSFSAYSPGSGMDCYWQYGGNGRVTWYDVDTSNSDTWYDVASGHTIPASYFTTGGNYMINTSVTGTTYSAFAGTDAGSSLAISAEQNTYFYNIGMPTATATPSATPTDTETLMPTDTATPTDTDTPTPGATWSDTPTATETDTDTPVSTETMTETPYIAPTFTSTVPLNIALDAPSMTFITGGESGIFSEFRVESYQWYTGPYCAGSGIGGSPGKKCWLETSVTGPCDLMFYWLVSASTYNSADALYLVVDGGDVDVLNTSWGYYKKYTYHVPAGTHTFRWEHRQVSTDYCMFLIDTVSTAAATATPTITQTFTDSPTTTPSHTASPTATDTASPTPTFTSTSTPSWKSAGAAIAGGTTYYTCMASDGSDVYAGYSLGGTLYVKKYNGTSWEALGGAVGTGEPGGRWLAATNGKIYAVYKGGSEYLYLKVYNPDTLSWDIAATSATISRSPALWIDKTTDRVYTAAYNGSKLVVMEYVPGAGMSQLGTAFGDSPYVTVPLQPVAITGYNTGELHIFVGYVDGASNNRAEVFYYRASNGYWDLAGNPHGTSTTYSTAADMSISMDSNGLTTVYVMLQDGDRHETSVFKASTIGNWSWLGSASLSFWASYNDVRAVTGTQEVYAAFQDYSGSNYLTVKKYTGTAWENTGNIRFSGEAAEYISMALSGAGIFTAYRTPAYDINTWKYQ